MHLTDLHEAHFLGAPYVDVAPEGAARAAHGADSRQQLRGCSSSTAQRTSLGPHTQII